MKKPPGAMWPPAAFAPLLGWNAIGSLAVVAFERGDLQAHLALHRAAEEAADRMGLPLRGLGEFSQRCSTGPLEQLQDLGCFSAWPEGRGFAFLSSGCSKQP